MTAIVLKLVSKNNEAKRLGDFSLNDVNILKQVDETLNDPNSSLLEKMRAKYAKASINENWAEIFKHGQIIDKLIAYKVDVRML